jgi:hypothetical protein
MLRKRFRNLKDDTPHFYFRLLHNVIVSDQHSNYVQLECNDIPTICM